MTIVRSEMLRGWRILVASAVGVGVGLGGIPFFTLGVFLKPLSEAFAWTRAEVAATSLCISIGAGATAPFIGELADRYDVRRIALVSLMAMCIAYLGLTQLNGNIWTLYLGVIVLTVCSSGTSPLVWVLAVSTWFDRARGLALGVTLAGSGVTAIAAPRLVDQLIAAHGWQAGYIGIALFTGLIALPIVFLFFDGKRPQPGGAGAPAAERPGLSVKQALRTASFWRLACGALLVNGAVVTMLVHFVALLTDQGMTRTLATSIAGVLGVAVLIGRLGIGFLMDRLNAASLAGVVFLFPSIGLVLLAFKPDDVTLAVLSAVLFGLASAAEVDLLGYLAGRLFGMRHFGTIYGLLIIAHLTGGGVGPILLGYVHDVRGTYGPGLLAVAVASLFGAILTGSLRRSFSFAMDGAH